MAHYQRINPAYSRREHPLFRRWTGIRQMIYNPNCPDYNPRLKCRGLDDFDEFVEFIEEEIGACPNQDFRINRLNQKKGWVPGNIRWATSKQVGNNRSNNLSVEYRGRRHTLVEWSEITGLHYNCLLGRYHMNWPIEDMLTWPSDPTNKHRNAA